MNFKDRIRRVAKSRAAKGTLAATLMVGAVMGGAQSATAIETDHDYMPAGGSGYYNSSDDGARGGIGASGTNVISDGLIEWHYDYAGNYQDTVHVQIRLKDNLCDGDAPVALVEFMDGSTVVETRAWIYTGGCGTSVLEHATFDSTEWDPFKLNGVGIDDSYGIRITICNGGQRGTTYAPGPFDFCGAKHGPFHHDLTDRP